MNVAIFHKYRGIFPLESFINIGIYYVIAVIFILKYL